MKGKTLLKASIALLSFVVYLLMHQGLVAAEPVTIQGQVVNGSRDGVLPSELGVTLHIFDSEGSLETRNATTDPGGYFSFEGVDIDESKVYTISSAYKDVSYSQRLDLPLSESPPVLKIFDTTEDLGALKIDSHVWFIHEINEGRREVTALEIVLVTNTKDQTFQPSLAQPSNMSFLRFSLPPQASALEVQSDLSGGDVISVGTGFGITSPVLPGSHQIAFTYRFPYADNEVSLSRSFPQGSDSFRVLLPTGLGTAQGPELKEVDSTVIGDTTYRVWEARSVEPRSLLFLELRNLPKPSLWQGVRDGFTDGEYWRIGIPSFLGLGLVVLLIYALMFRPRAPLPATASGPPYDVSNQESTEGLLGEVARLDNLFEEQRISETEYRQRRAELKGRLIERYRADKEEAHSR